MNGNLTLSELNKELTLAQQVLETTDTSLYLSIIVGVSSLLAIVFLLMLAIQFNMKMNRGLRKCL